MSDTPFDTIPYLPSVSPAKLIDRVRLDLTRFPELVELNRFAEGHDFKVLFLGQSATDFLHFSRITLLGDLQGLLQSSEEKLENILGRKPGFTIGVQSSKGESLPSHCRAEATRAIEDILGHKVEEIVYLDREFLESSRTFDYLPVLDIGNGVAWEISVNSTQSELNYPPFLVSLASGELKYKDYETKLLSSSRDANGQQFLFALQIIGKKLKYGLEIEESLFNKIEDIFDNFKVSEVAPEIIEDLEKEGVSIFLNALDLEDASNILQHLGVLSNLYRKEDITTKGSFSFFAFKEPLRSFPVLKQYFENPSIFLSDDKAIECGIQFLVHQTDEFSGKLISSHPANKVNAFISRKMTTGEEALYGGGFYTQVGIDPMLSRGDTTVLLELASNAVQNTHFVRMRNYISTDFCRVISSHPDFVRVVNQGSRPLYRPKLFSPRWTNFEGAKTDYDRFSRIALRAMKLFKK